MAGKYLGRDEGEFHFSLLPKLLRFFFTTIDLARNVRYYLVFHFSFLFNKVYFIRRMMDNVYLGMNGN